MGGLKAARVDTGETISPSAARRLACEAGIVPAVLDSNSRVLDLGHTKRFHNRAQRIVATIEQRGCPIDGCDYPPGMIKMGLPGPLGRRRPDQPRRHHDLPPITTAEPTTPATT